MQRVEMDDWPVFMEPSCETLFMCFMTTFKEGIRAGGGISDVLRKPASHVRICNGKGGKEKLRGRWLRERGKWGGGAQCWIKLLPVLCVLL